MIVFPDPDHPELKGIPLKNKLIIAAIFLAAGGFMLFNATSGKRDCERYCHRKGFASSQYVGASGTNAGRARCGCYKEGETFPSTTVYDF